MFRSFTIFSAILWLNHFSLVHADDLETADCAKVTPVEGSLCPKLRVIFDLSACKDKAVSSPTVKCEGTKATVAVRSADYEYKVVFEEVESWGRKTYQMVGFVNKDSLNKASQGDFVSEPEVQKPSPVKTEPKVIAHEEVRKSETHSVEPVRPASVKRDSLVFSGLVDAYYSYNFDRPRSIDLPAASVNSSMPAGKNIFRAYDVYHNQFTLNQVELSAKKTNGPLGFVLDVDFGEMADLNHAVPSDAGSTVTVTDEVSKHIGQAVVTYQPAQSSGWSFSFGKMPTHLGYEVIKAKDNWQYSRSVTYWLAIPVWHMGAAVGFPVSDSMSGSVYIYNGWNQLNDNNDGKTYGLQLKWTPDSDTTAVYNGITGPELDKDNGSWRSVNELNLSYQAAPTLALAVEGLFGYEPTTVGDANKWIGITGHLKWDATSNLYMSPRMEYFRDSTGSRFGTAFGKSQNIISGTFTLGYQVVAGLTVKPELRYDLSQSGEIFTDRDGEAKKTQATLSLAALYNF